MCRREDWYREEGNEEVCRNVENFGFGSVSLGWVFFYFCGVRAPGGGPQKKRGFCPRVVGVLAPSGSVHCHCGSAAAG